MKFLLIIFFISLTLFTSAQSINNFDGRWCFTGSRISIFIVKGNTLFFTLLSENDTNLFSKFYSGMELEDSITLFPVTIDSVDSKIFLNTRVTYRKKEQPIFFIFDKTNDTTLNFVGDVYYNSSRVKNANKNCNLDVPACNIYFYHREEIKKISQLKELKNMSRKEAFNVFTEFGIISKQKCNKCYEGFTGSDFNRIVINMGFNPIYQEKINSQTFFSTSAFDFIMKNMVGKEQPRIDQELYNHCEKILNEFTGR